MSERSIESRFEELEDITLSAPFVNGLVSDLKNQVLSQNSALLEALEDYLNSGTIQGMSENSMHYADVSQKCLCLKCINKRARKALAEAIQGEPV